MTRIPATVRFRDFGNAIVRTNAFAKDEIIIRSTLARMKRVTLATEKGNKQLNGCHDISQNNGEAEKRQNIHQGGERDEEMSANTFPILVSEMPLEYSRPEIKSQNQSSKNHAPKLRYIQAEHFYRVLSSMTFH